MLPPAAVEYFGGHASRRELLSVGCDDTFIKLCLGYRTILPTRRGWYALPGTPAPIIRALRAGGRLACVSALTWYAGCPVPEEEPVHILVPYGASRLGRDAVVHWTRGPLPVDRLVVPRGLAELQAERCRGG